MNIIDRIFKPQHTTTPSHTGTFLPPYDFGAALPLTPEERFRACIERVQQYHRANGDAQLLELPPVPPAGATPQELVDLERQLQVALPAEYGRFLHGWRYLDIDDGLRVWGLSYQDVSVDSPWVSEEHRPPCKYLVFGDYWHYADGDQLMFDLNEPDVPVVVYLHDCGPLIEYFAPSFSLALWRMVDERCQ